MSQVTALVWIGVAGAIGLVALIVQGFWLAYLSRARSVQAYLQGIEEGWREGWDDRDNDRYPDADPYQGKHHVTAEQAEKMIAELVAAAETAAPTEEPGTVLINCKTSRDSDNPSVLALPKRIPGASR